MADPQESRTAVVGFRVTPTERRRLELVLQAREERGEIAPGGGMFELFRPAMEVLLEEAQEVRRHLAQLP